MNAEIKLEKMRRTTLRMQADRELILALANNPVFEIIAAFLAIEYCQTHGDMVVDKWGRIDKEASRPLIPPLAGSMAEAGVLVAVALQQGGMDLLKASVVAGGESLKAVTKLLPASLAVLK